MKKWIVLLMAMALTGLIFWSCSDDSSTEPTNKAPTCSITAPTDNATFTIGNNITVNVDAADTDGTISEVRFYFDGNGIGSDTSFPYSYSISTSSYSEGTHTIKATAKDNDGTETSSQTNINLTSGITPPLTPTLVSPTNGNTVQDLTPTFDWNDATGATSYTILVDNNSTFASPEINQSPSTSTYTPGSNLTVGTYYWKVLATNAAGSSAYTTAWTVTISTSTPSGMVLIPGGTFTMGDNLGDGYSDELPIHSVTLSSFYMGKYEVTQAEWSAYMPAENWSSYGTGDTYPAYYVSWYEIIKYCNLRSMAEGFTPCYTINSSTNPADWGAVPTSSNATWNAAICNWSANGYRLPSEAEWEYAARGGLSGQRFPNGATISHSTNGDTQANYYAQPSSYSYDVSPTTGYHPSYNGKSSPVGSFPPNGYGLYDMSGNLWEWCWDWYSSSYYSSSPSSNPTGPTSGSYRVIRGGSWGGNAGSCRVALRDNLGPYGSGGSMGFRLSRTP